MPVCFISNIHQHWFAVNITQTTIEIFDSLGPKSKLFTNDYMVKFLCNNLINRKLITIRQLQSYSSWLCGYFCLVILKLRSSYISCTNIETLFSTDLEKNDSIIRNIFKDLI